MKYVKTMNPNKEENMALSKMTLVEFYNQMADKNAQDVYLDVRRIEEFNDGHVQSAKHIPVEELSYRHNELDRNKNYFIYCKRGGRAQTAFEILRTNGFENLVCIYDAGMDLWKENNYPIES
jgi:rhodanese-related sulfurtransferase